MQMVCIYLMILANLLTPIALNKLLLLLDFTIRSTPLKPHLIIDNHRTLKPSCHVNSLNLHRSIPMFHSKLHLRRWKTLPLINSQLPSSTRTPSIHLPNWRPYNHMLIPTGNILNFLFLQPCYKLRSLSFFLISMAELSIIVLCPKRVNKSRRR